MTILSHIVNQYPNNYLKAIIFEINKRDKKKNCAKTNRYTKSRIKL